MERDRGRRAARRHRAARRRSGTAVSPLVHVEPDDARPRPSPRARTAGRATVARTGSAAPSTPSVTTSPATWRLSSSAVPSATIAPWSMIASRSPARRPPRGSGSSGRRSCRAPRRLADLVPHPGPGLRVEAGRRLVEEQHVRADGRCRGRRRGGGSCRRSTCWSCGRRRPRGRARASTSAARRAAPSLVHAVEPRPGGPARHDRSRPGRSSRPGARSRSARGPVAARARGPRPRPWPPPTSAGGAWRACAASSSCRRRWARGSRRSRRRPRARSTPRTASTVALAGLEGPAQVAGLDHRGRARGIVMSISCCVPYAVDGDHLHRSASSVIICAVQIVTHTGACVKPWFATTIDSVVRRAAAGEPPGLVLRPDRGHPVRPVRDATSRRSRPCIDTGASTAGRLSELIGLTSGAVTRVHRPAGAGGLRPARARPADRRRRHRRARPREGAAAIQATSIGSGSSAADGDRALHRRPAGGDQRLPDAMAADHPRTRPTPPARTTGGDPAGRRRAGPSIERSARRR